MLSPVDHLKLYGGVPPWPVALKLVVNGAVPVSGDPLRTNAYVFAHNGILGYPTTKRVELPPLWPRLLREARDGDLR